MGAPVLVAYASKMGGTTEIAQAIAREIRAHGIDVDLMRARDVRTLNSYEYVVAGSAIYAGHWRREAMRLLRGYRKELSTRQVWLFQSGLTVARREHPANPVPESVRKLATEIGTGPPEGFAGRLTRASARGVVARLMSRQASAGDFRDWERIRDWSADVADRIAARQVETRRAGVTVTP